KRDKRNLNNLDYGARYCRRSSRASARWALTKRRAPRSNKHSRYFDPRRAASVCPGIHINSEAVHVQEWRLRFIPSCRAAAVAAAISCLVGGAARADDDEDCNNIMDELKKLSERLMNTTDPKGVGPVCAATGQLLGIIKASREVAAECYDEGRKRDQMLLTFDKVSKDMESKIDSVCK